MWLDCQVGGGAFRQMMGARARLTANRLSKAHRVGLRHLNIIASISRYEATCLIAALGCFLISPADPELQST